MATSRQTAQRKLSQLPLLIVLAALLAVYIILHEVIPLPGQSGEENEVEAFSRASAQAGLVISEVMTDNVSAFPDENGRFGDWVEIYNDSDAPISLKNVGLSDRSDKIKFLFPDVTLNPRGYVVVFCDNVNRDDAHGVFHAKFKLSSKDRESLFLFDANARPLDSVALPVMNFDESYVRDADGQWTRTEDYSPGYENTAAGHAAYMGNYTIEPGALILNEVCPSPRSLFRDEDDETSDWVELYNASNQDIRLGRFALSDDESKPLKWTFPEAAVIPAGGYYIVFCSGKDKVEETTLYPHTNFSINNEEETLVLSTITGELIDRVTVTGVGRDMSWGRDPDSLIWQTFTNPTPGEPNNQAGVSKADRYRLAVNPTGVQLSEVMSSASMIKAFPDYSAGDWVEIYNSSAQIWDLSGWGLSDNINWPRKWTFPQGAVIQPGEYKVILLTKYEGENVNSARLQASFGLTRAGGEMITLSDATGRVLDRMYLPEIPTDISYGRTLGMNGFFYYDAPTPGAANGTGFLGFSQRPAFVTPSGLYPDTVQVEITAAPTATIRYTTDGSIPTLDNSQVYTGPIQLDDAARSIVIRARAFESGLQPSDTATATYILKSYYTLDVVSLVCDPEELWNTTNGLLSDAPDLQRCTEVNKSKLPFRTPIYRTYGKVDRQGYVEIFSQETGQAYISQGVKMDLMGAYSLDMPQKSFKIRAQAALGAKYFDYPLFEERDYTYYKSFTLRNSGNDCVFTRVADGVQTRLIDKYLESPILTLAWKPVIVFLNGEYWGHYNMRERKDRFSIAQHEGLDLEKDKEIYENITIIRGSLDAEQGSSKEFKAMINEFKNLKPNEKPADLQYIYDHIDVESFIEWFAIKMYFGDSDPGNIMYYKLPGGKWKCLMFDLDYGLYNSEFNSPWSYMKTVGMGEQKINNVIFRKMLESDEIRDKFFTRLGFILQTLTSETMIAELDECTAIIQPELKWHYERWASHPDTKYINEESPTSADGYLRYWQQRVNRMKNVMNKRPHFLWGFVQDEFKLSDEEMLRYFGERPANLGY